MRRASVPDKINLAEKFSLFSEQWRPKTVAALNGQEVKIVKVQGTFPWHHHDAEDEFFLVWKGRFRVEFRDHVVELGPGEALVVPRGIEHRTAADDEAEIILFEPAATRNTGNVVDATFTAPDSVTL
jgi:mannose-6-phosphate isomerase-like protein (cupin superfamily)